MTSLLTGTRLSHTYMKTKLTAAIVGAFLRFGSFAAAEEKTTIRFGHFPNITHAQGVIAHALSRQGKGWFEQRLGPNARDSVVYLQRGPFGNGGDLRGIA